MTDDDAAIRDTAIRLAANPERCGPRGVDPGRHVETVWFNFCDCFTDWVDFLYQVERMKHLKKARR